MRGYSSRRATTQGRPPCAPRCRQRRQRAARGLLRFRPAESLPCPGSNEVLTSPGTAYCRVGESAAEAATLHRRRARQCDTVRSHSPDMLMVSDLRIVKLSHDVATLISRNVVANPRTVRGGHTTQLTGVLPEDARLTLSARPPLRRLGAELCKDDRRWTTGHRRRVASRSGISRRAPGWGSPPAPSTSQSAVGSSHGGARCGGWARGTTRVDDWANSGGDPLTRC